MNFPGIYDDYVQYEGYVVQGENLTVVDGYVDTEDLVNELLTAGENLNNWREEQYDYNGDEGEDLDEFNDRTRSPNYDYADASMDMERVTKIYRDKRDAAARAAASAKLKEEVSNDQQSEQKEEK